MQKVVSLASLTINDGINVFHKSVSIGVKIEYYCYCHLSLFHAMFENMVWRDLNLLQRSNYVYDFSF